MTDVEELMRDLQSIWTLRAKQDEQYHWSEQSLIMLQVGQVDLAKAMDARVQTLTQELLDMVTTLNMERHRNGSR